MCLKLQKRGEEQTHYQSPWRALIEGIANVGDRPIVVAQRGEDLSKRYRRVGLSQPRGERHALDRQRGRSRHRRIAA